MTELVVRPATDADVPAISRIYNEAVLTTTASWDLDVEPLEKRRSWFAARRAAGHAVLTAAGGRIIDSAGRAIRFGETRADFIIPEFIAFGDPELAIR